VRGATWSRFRDEVNLEAESDVESRSLSICDEIDLAVADNIKPRPPLFV